MLWMCVYASVRVCLDVYTRMNMHMLYYPNFVGEFAQGRVGALHMNLGERKKNTRI